MAISIKPFEISTNHWLIEEFKQCVTGREWRSYLQAHERTIIVRGHLRTLRAKSIGGGMFEISKDPSND